MLRFLKGNEELYSFFVNALQGKSIAQIFIGIGFHNLTL